MLQASRIGQRRGLGCSIAHLSIFCSSVLAIWTRTLSLIERLWAPVEMGPRLPWDQVFSAGALFLLVLFFVLFCFFGCATWHAGS